MHGSNVVSCSTNLDFENFSTVNLSVNNYASTSVLHAMPVKAMHAGLECGIIGETIPGIDMISFGPTIKNPHSPDEVVEIKTLGTSGKNPETDCQQLI